MVAAPRLPEHDALAVVLLDELEIPEQRLLVGTCPVRVKLDVLGELDVAALEGAQALLEPARYHRGIEDHVADVPPVLAAVDPATVPTGLLKAASAHPELAVEVSGG